MKKVSPHAGFTVPELIVVIAVVVAAILASLVFIHPQDYSRSNRNAERLLHLAQISQAITRYHAEHGSLPDGIFEAENVIGNAEQTNLDLCVALVPAYLEDMPTDPKVGVKLAKGNCVNTEENPSVYTTGYTIKRDGKGAVVLTAPGAEGEKITLSRTY